MTNYTSDSTPIFVPAFAPVVSNMQGKHCYPPENAHLYYYHPYYGYPGDYPRQDNARKCQRRQTAGAFMQTLFRGATSTGGKKKNSTAQPRPPILVPPRGIGPVRQLNPNDVLSGRGGRINSHPGNVQFRELVQMRKKDYLAKSTKKLDKAHIAAEIVQYIRRLDPPGRFLKQDADGTWYEIGDAKAIKKVGQALREDAPDIRQELDLKKEGSFENDNATAAEGEKKSGSASVSSSIHTKTKSSNHSSPVQKVSPRTVSSKDLQQSLTSSEPYQPLAFQEIAPPPSYVVPSLSPQSQGQCFSSMGMHSVSGAAAAAMEQEEDNQHFEVPSSPADVAFGRTFHPPQRVEAPVETSLISGLSVPSVTMSGVSNISGLSDPISSLSAEASKRHTFVASGSSHHQSATRDSSALASRGSGSMISGHSDGMNPIPLSNMRGPSDIAGDVEVAALLPSLARYSSGGSRWGSGAQQPNYLPQFSGMSNPDQARAFYHPGNPQYPSAEDSVASMSVNSISESLPSMPGSIISDLSANLSALGLAEPKLLNR